MAAEKFKSLYNFAGHFKNHQQLADMVERLDKANAVEHGDNRLEETINIYRQALPLIENTFWSVEPDNDLVSSYQEVFRELEDLISRKGDDSRHRFIIVIPVADRPQHLQQCLHSLFQLCQFYGYGGHNGQAYSKIYVIIADDSKHQENMERHRSICSDFTRQGLETEYFGRDKQIEQVAALRDRNSEALSRILGHHIKEQDYSSFFHKGAAITRNITYLRLNQIINNNNHRYLIHFIDSDQEFKIKVCGSNTQRDLYAINYFYHLDDIFTRTDAGILTGKVVGDPPVSPAVMAANFQSDVIAFLQQIAAHKPSDSCRFHNGNKSNGDEASYHDMAFLFGFDNTNKAFDYHCELPQPHDHAACFNNFASKLNRFFDGEHPTRVTCFNYENGPEKAGLSATVPARTVYTGNYIFRPEYLEYFIPFARLKLRMAGPVLGRLIRSEIRQQFVSANLPLLHNRTVTDIGRSEFRPGVVRNTSRVDLSNEFERQFYGDVMLFTVDELTQAGYPDQQLTEDRIYQALSDTTIEMRNQYEAKHRQVLEKIKALKTILNDTDHWWHDEPALEPARTAFTRFIDNIEFNFGDQSHGYMLINSATHQRKRQHEMLEALVHYASDREAWRDILK